MPKTFVGHIIYTLIGIVVTLIISWFLALSQKDTDIHIDGNWTMEIQPKGPDKRATSGYCTITQVKHKSIFNFSGYFDEIENCGETTQEASKFEIHSQFAGFKDRQIFFIYKNQRNEEGIFRGDIDGNSNKPLHFTVNYSDLAPTSLCNVFTGDNNNDPCGTIVFTRVNNDDVINVMDYLELLMMMTLTIILIIMIVIYNSYSQDILE